jgi:hypothetical protein
MAELVTHDRALLVLAQELENTLRHDDAGVRAKQPISEGGRIPVWDEADAGRAEAVVVGHLMHELMHRGIAHFDRGVVEELKLVEPAQRQVGQPRANQPDEKIDDDGEDDCRGQIDLAHRHHGGENQPDHHAHQDAEGDQRREEETGQLDPPRSDERRELSLRTWTERCQNLRDRGLVVVALKES